MTKTDIFNKALMLIGHDRTITEGETDSTEYLRCQSEWDGARIFVLTYHPWNWLVDESAMTEGAETTVDTSDKLAYTYDRPDCLRLVAVLDGYEKKVKFRQANGLIYTDCPEVKFQTISDPDLTDGIPSEWPQGLIDAMAAELASRIGLSMTANGKVVQAMKQLAIGSLVQAMTLDAKEMEFSGSDGNKYDLSRR